MKDFDLLMILTYSIKRLKNFLEHISLIHNIQTVHVYHFYFFQFYNLFFKKEKKRERRASSYKFGQCLLTMYSFCGQC